MKLPILYQDDTLVAINKPAGLLVHRSPIDKHETQFALQLLREQLQYRVFPVHRLDKPTSGVLLFALDSETARKCAEQWHENEKTYWAITRGKVTDRCLNHAITTRPDKGDTFTKAKIQAAETDFRLLTSIELPVVFGRQAITDKHYRQTAFSWVQATPKTGRKHQIRKHLKHLNHPIVGDTRYGRGEINRYFRTNYNVYRLLLHCHCLRFRHPHSRQTHTIIAPTDGTWRNVLHTLF